MKKPFTFFAKVLLLASCMAAGICNVYAQTTYYSFQSGNFSGTSGVWTTDPTGATLVGDPGATGPAANSNLVILAPQNIVWNTVTTLGTVTINSGATFDIQSRTGLTINTLSGQGTFRQSTVTLPTITTNNIINSGGGTWEYYNITGTLPTTSGGNATYNNLILSKTDANSNNYTITLLSNMSINGNLTVQRTAGTGTVTWQINDASATQRRMRVSGNLTVTTGAAISVGTGTPADGVLPSFNTQTYTYGNHVLLLYGDLINTGGTVQFFNTTGDADPRTGGTQTIGNGTTNYVAASKNTAVCFCFAATNTQGYSASVNVDFYGSNDARVVANGTTDFFRIRINKNSATNAVRFFSNNSNNFKLWGPNNTGDAATATTADTGKAFVIYRGIARFGNNITIPSLSEGGKDYIIVSNATIWTDSASVKISNNTGTAASDYFWDGLVVIGQLKVTAGTFDADETDGLNQAPGIQIPTDQPGAPTAITLSGGTINSSQTWVINATNTSYITFTISGGTLNLNRSFGAANALFDLNSTNAGFVMSGGIININSTTGNTPNAFRINTSTSGTSVTGGTLNVNLANGTAATFQATVPIPALVLTNTSGTGNFTLTNNNAVAKTVFGGITINANTTLDMSANASNLAVSSGNFTVNGFYTTTTALTTSLTGTGNQTLSGTGTITNLGSLTASGGGTKTMSRALTVNGALTIGSSTTFADGGNTITVLGNVSNSGTHTGAGSITLAATTAAQSIGGSGTGVFQNLTLNNTNGAAGSTQVSLTAAQTVNGTLTLSNDRIFNLGGFNLAFGSTAPAVSGTLGTNRHIITNTTPAPGDGGITKTYSSGNLTFTFPLGSGTAGGYSPATFTVSGTPTTFGSTTIRVVDAASPYLTGSPTAFISRYWKTTSSGWTLGSATVSQAFTYVAADENGTNANYAAGRFNPSSITWTAGVTGDVNTGSRVVSFNTATFNTTIDGEYTAAQTSAFGTPTVLYSCGNLNWNAGTGWSNTSNCAATAQAGPGNSSTALVVVQNGHTVTVTANGNCASLTVNSGGTVVAQASGGTFTFTNANSVVQGQGTVRVASTAATFTFPAGDWSSFLGTTGGTFQYDGSTTQSQTLPASPTSYNNLTLNLGASGTFNLTTPNVSNFRVLGNFVSQTSGGTGANIINTGGTTDSFVVRGTVNVNSGTLTFGNNAAARRLHAIGTVTVANGATFQVNNNGAIAHTFFLGGSLVNNGTVNFSNTSTATLYFSGAANATISGTSTAATFSNITVDKGTSNTPVLDVTLGGTATFQTNNWLTLTNGTFRWSRAATISLLTGATNFTIPSTSRLSLNSAGTINVTTAANDASDLLLSGALELTSSATGGAINVGSSANNNNNDIEYGVAGGASISVAGGTLYVNGQVRRNTSVSTGVLQFSQSGGTVQVGGRNAQTSRGVFEIENNTGTAFAMTGGTLWVQRPDAGGSFADLYLRPVTATATGGTVRLGDGSIGAQTLTMDCTAPLFNLQCFRNAAANVQTIRPQNNNVTLNGSLTIDDNTIFDLNTNALSVSIGAGLTVGGGTSGQFLGQNTNTTTTFNSSSTGTVTLNAGSTANFNNITVNKSSGTLTVASVLTTNNNFNLAAGTVNHGTVNINVLGTVTNNGTFTSTAGSGFVVPGGTTGAAAAYTIAGSGTYGSLRLGGTAASATFTMSGANAINGQLDLSQGSTSRILSIGANNLALGTSATINGTASVTRMITTNGFVSAGGVSKVLGTGSQTFTFPVGVTLYTPYTLNTLNVTSGGTLTVIPVSSVHPTAVTSGTDRYLNYYWRVTASGGLAVGTATSNFIVNRSSATISGSTGTAVGKGINASNPTGWVAANDATTNADPNFTWSLASSTAAFPASGNSFDYSVGTTNTLPISLASFTSGASGNFDDAATWGTTVAPGSGQPVTVSNGNTVTIRPNSVVSATVNAGGTGYTTGDVVAVVGGGGSGARLNVTASAGVITGFTVRVGGTDYSTSTGLTLTCVTCSGSPSGGTANITTQLGISPLTTTLSGTGQLTVGTTVGHNLGAISGTGTLSMGTATLPGGTYTSFVASGGGTITYSPSSTITMSTAATSTYNNLTFSGGNTINLPSANITVNGSLSLSGSGTTLNNPSGITITLLGNLTEGSGTTLSDANGTFSFNGTSAQTVTGSGSFNNLTLNNSAGLTLAGTGPTNVAGVLTLTNGVLTSNSVNQLTMGLSSSVSGGSSSSFVTGPMSKALGGSGSFTFPLGASGQYRATTIANTSGSDTWTAQYFVGSPSPAGYNNQLYSNTFTSINGFEYWDVSRAGSTSADLTLAWGTGSYTGGGVGTVTDMRVARWNGSQWDIPPGTGTNSPSGTSTAGFVTRTNITSFSPFTTGSTTSSTLPVRWIYFTARPQDGNVVLNWATGSELNNDRFEVERSTDGNTFAKIGAVLGSGTTNNVSTYTYLDAEAPTGGRIFYRLRQVDFDGSAEYSVVVEVTGGQNGKTNWAAFPNPFSGRELQLVATDGSLETTTPLNFRLVNTAGVEIGSRRTTLAALNNDLRDLVAELVPGMYVLLVQSPKGLSSMRIVKR